MNFEPLLEADLKTLLGFFAAVCGELAQQAKELAELLAAEKQAKVQAWMGSEGTSIQARDREADQYASGLTVDIIKLKGQITANEQEKEVLSLLIDMKRR